MGACAATRNADRQQHTGADAGQPTTRINDVFQRPPDSHDAIRPDVAIPADAGRERNIGYVRAHSPQAKGRIERLWATLQDRLVSELRLRRIATPAAANAFLPSFRADFNRRFTRAALAPPVWRRPPADLDLQLSCRYQRVVARDNTVRLGARLVLIPPGPGRRSFARCRVEVRELLDGRVVVLYADQIIARQAAATFEVTPRHAPNVDRPRPRGARPSARRLQTALAELAASTAPTRPRVHPWRYPFSRLAPFREPRSTGG